MNNLSYKLLLAYWVIINIFTIYLFWKDKRQARRHKTRVPNNTLLLMGFLGGEIGGILAMLCIHHKLHKWRFRLMMPLFIVMHAALIYAVLWVNEII